MRHWESGHTIAISGSMQELLEKSSLEKSHKLFMQVPYPCNVRTVKALFKTFTNIKWGNKPRDVLVSTTTKPPSPNPLNPFIVHGVEVAH